MQMSKWVIININNNLPYWLFNENTKMHFSVDYSLMGVQCIWIFNMTYEYPITKL